MNCSCSDCSDPDSDPASVVSYGPFADLSAWMLLAACLCLASRLRLV